MPKSFYIIDGHAQIYRAYHAPFRDLSSPTGEPTKATFVFTQRILNLINDRKPDYLAMVIDSGDETVFRREFYPQYKANRPPRPDDFLPQEQRILRIVKEAGIPIFAAPGFEADDLIATMAKRLNNTGFETFIVSNDKDLRQLLNDCTKMYDPYDGNVTDPASMEAKHGYTPAQAVEVQTLTGDATDNVPGIPGVGPKTAAKLIHKYGTADAVLLHLDELTPKLRENFEKHGKDLPLSRRLVTLRDDVQFEFDPEACKFAGVDNEALRKQFEALGFTNLLRRFTPEPPAPAPNPPAAPRVSTKPATPTQPGLFEESLFPGMGSSFAAPPTVTAPIDPGYATGAGCKYELVQTEEQFEKFLAELRQQKRFAFDTETDALGALNSNLVGMSFSWQEGTGWYVPVCGPTGSSVLPCARVLEAVRPVLEDETIAKVGHNIKYDLLVLRNIGVTLRGIAMDSMVAAFLLDASRMQYGIDRLALEHLKFRKVATSDLIGSGRSQISMSQVELSQIACYAAEDADIALRLADGAMPQLASVPALRKLHDDLETPLIDVLAEMEFNGIAIDPAILNEQSGVLGERVEQLRTRIHEAAGVEFNPDSPKQLGDILFRKLKLKPVKRTKTGTSTDVEVLEKLANHHPVPKLVLEYRSLVKLKNTYLDNLTDYINPRTGRIHGNFNQTGAATGRLSMSDPNLQNIPIRTDEGRRIRLAFVPGDPAHNVLLTADYSQIELRILAHFTEEPALLRAFEADEDIHRAVASEVFNVPLEAVTRDQRGQAKTINFGIVYGVSAFGLSRRIEGLSVSAAGKLIASYNQRFPRIHEFLIECVKHAQEHGYVQTILGRRRSLPEINSGVLTQRNASERMAINSVVQGSAADLIKVAMLNVYRRLRKEGRPSRMLLQVHDELVFETPLDAVETDKEIVRAEMVNAMKLKAPLKVELGWARNWQEVK
jgi:DNA polymerase-1